MPEISNIIDVQTNVTAAGVVARNLGRTLFLYEATDVASYADAGLKTRKRDIGVNVYADAKSVNADYASTHEAAKAGAAYFAQNPKPENYLTGARFAAGAKSYVQSSADLSAYTDAVDGDLQIGVHNVSVTFAVGDNTGAKRATKIQTAIRTIAALNLAEVEFISASSQVKYRLTVPVSQAAEVTGPITGTLGVALKWDSADTAFPGVNVETLAQALDRLRTADDSWYWLVADSTVASDQTKLLAIANWAATNEVMFVADIANDDGALAVNESTSRTAALSALEHSRNTAIWSRTFDYKSASLAARFSSINFDAADSMITAKFKTLPGRKSDVLTSVQADELTRKRTNFYSPFGGTNIFAEGVTCNPNTYIDVQYWLDWLVNELRTELFNLQLRSRRITQTDYGVASVLSVVDSVLERGVENGGIAPGTLSESVAAAVRKTTGNNQFNGFLPAGYLSFISPLAEQSQTDRAQRKLPTIHIWCKGSGAVHSADIIINFED